MKRAEIIKNGNVNLENIHLGIRTAPENSDDYWNEVGAIINNCNSSFKFYPHVLELLNEKFLILKK